jgi:hypothetical protein
MRLSLRGKAILSALAINLALWGMVFCVAWRIMH